MPRKVMPQSVRRKSVARQFIKIMESGCLARMRGNSTSNFASNETTPGWKECTEASPLAGTDCRASIVNHSQHRVSLHLAIATRYRCFLVAQNPHRRFWSSEPSTRVSNTVGNPNLIHNHFRVNLAFEAIEMIQRFSFELVGNIQEREKIEIVPSWI